MVYSREDACRAWLTHGHLRYDQLRLLLQTYGTAEKVYDCILSGRDETVAELLTEAQRNKLRSLGRTKVMHDMLLKMRDAGIQIMGQDDAVYPQRLLETDDPPVFLYWKGDPDCLRERCITMVGTRHATRDASRAATRIARELAERGVTIVSGMAVGIDQAAHEGCLEAEGRTAAVLGTGLDVPYPSGTKELKEQILDLGGILLS